MKKKKSAWHYLWFALYAFGGLGLEILLVGVIEPLIFSGAQLSKYTREQSIFHWLLTIICWSIVAFLLIRSSKHNLNFDVLSERQIDRKGILISIVLVIICITLNVLDWGTLKSVDEFQKKGLLLFSFQYLYYIFEVMLVFLIVGFGQKFFESMLHKESSIPWGGIVLACTWGAVHFLTKGNLIDGLCTMAYGILYGMIYLSLNRNAKWSYLAMTLAFIV